MAIWKKENFLLYLHNIREYIKSCLVLWDSMDCTTLGFPCLSLSPRQSLSLTIFSLFHYLTLSLLKVMSTETVMPSNHLILCLPLLFLPSIFPSIRVLSNESALHIRWPEYWSFSFSISPSNEYLELISIHCSKIE